MQYQAATQPTIYFIGVTTEKSSIMKVFPAWAEFLNLKNVVIKGINFPLHAEPQAYRQAVEFIRDDPLSLGALVTTHKLDLFETCRDLFDEIDPLALLMNETSCISKNNGKLICHAKDPITSGLALDGFLPKDYFAKTGAELLVIGAGGSAIAITWHLMRKARLENVPSRIVVTNRSQPRLNEIAKVHQKVPTDAKLEYILADKTEINDTVLQGMKQGSLIINATGLGKDAPGSPLSDSAKFPKDSIVWDLNYRGNLVFLSQAQKQQKESGLHIHNGWTYFLYGWTKVIAEVFHISIPDSGSEFEEIAAIAENVTRSV